ncbi:hypothetical protein SLS62_006312 [Diatrype stigma]|uniref:Imidazoleglycerol-phosphate dehydratase n=1 Tax=Diatrype stigma TaxID=117547 RepID=A0AAN9YR99_9PEZI
MRAHKALDSDDAREAQWAATRAAGVGAAKWGAAMAALGGAGYVFSPLYRSLTIQFKVYIQMSGMILGGMIAADNGMRQYEHQARLQRRIARDRAAWEKFEQEYPEIDDPPPPPSASAPASGTGTK